MIWLLSQASSLNFLNALIQVFFYSQIKKSKSEKYIYVIAFYLLRHFKSLIFVFSILLPNKKNYLIWHGFNVKE